MPITIRVSRWSYCSEEVLLAIKEHAARKAKPMIDWDAWLQDHQERFSGGVDVPYSVGEAIHDVIEAFCGDRGLPITYFVPYTFDHTLCDEFPPPRSFWFDEIRPFGWQSETLRIVEAAWFHDIWRGTVDDAYRQMAQDKARRFDAEYDRIKEQSDWQDSDVFELAYHYVEVGLIECLDYAIPRNLPVTIYP